jgi:hypothetical protein
MFANLIERTRETSMRSWVGAVALAVALLVASPPAGASDVAEHPRDAAGLAAMCNTPNRAFCYGYVTAAAQFYEAMINHDALDIAPFVCPGGEVTQQDAVALFLDWFAANPDAAGDSAIDGLFKAWIEAFPCQ